MAQTPKKDKRAALAGERRATGVTAEAIERIRGLVASGEWAPGTRLPRETDLARELGLSRSSLREAVRALWNARVLEVRQGDGTYVGNLEPSELLEPTLAATDLLRGRAVLELFQVRRMLEPDAAALVARCARTETIVALRIELDRMVAAGERAQDLVDADASFHDVIARAPGNGVLHALLRSVSTATIRTRLWHIVPDQAVLDLARYEHTRMFDAIASGDADLAKAATLVHIASSETWLRERIDRDTGRPIR